MSRRWTTEDELYIFKENIEVKRNELEPIMHMIESKLDKEVKFENVFDIIIKKAKEVMLKKEIISELIDKIKEIVEKLYSFKQLYNSKFGDEIVDVYLLKYNNLVTTVKSI